VRVAALEGIRGGHGGQDTGTGRGLCW
jgi:hypothetical protein